MLSGVIEADETHVDGKSRNLLSGCPRGPTDVGGGTKKTPVIGVIERDGYVIARLPRIYPVRESLTS